ncbi:MAG: PEMT/PEM2 family methyltransferase [Gemmatimonadales bacterium]
MSAIALIVAAAAAHLVFRLLYVVGVGVALRLEETRRLFTATRGGEGGFERFRSLASPVMALDAVTFVTMAWLTRGTLRVAIPVAVRIGVGAVLIVLAIGVKVWARETLGEKAYYWHNFFVPGAWTAPVSQGPYRWFRNPMYTVGYLHAYGFALAMASWPALLFALFDQGAILVFHFAVEEPHYRRLTGRERS